jgi:hypothetical protein
MVETRLGQRILVKNAPVKGTHSTSEGIVIVTRLGDGCFYARPANKKGDADKRFAEDAYHEWDVLNRNP